MIWRPRKTLGIVAGMFLGAVLALAMAAVLSALQAQSDDISLVLTVILLGLLVLVVLRWSTRIYGLLRLRYSLDRNALVIHLGTQQHTIPLDAILDIVPGHSLQWAEPAPVSVWPGYLSDRIAWDSTRPMWIHGTASPKDHLVVITDSALYAISPADSERFLEDYALRKSLGPVRSPAQESLNVGIAAWQVWHDRTYWSVMVVALLGNVALYAIAINAPRVSYLPAPDWFPARWIGAGIGSAVLFVNVLLGAVLYKIERVATWLLMIIGLLMQILLAYSVLLG